MNATIRDGSRNIPLLGLTRAMKGNAVTEHERKFRESHPPWMARNTGRWGFETLGDCADLRHDDYKSKLAAIRARNRECREAFGPGGYALTNEDGSPRL